MRSKHVVVLLMAAMAAYLLLLGGRALWLIGMGEPVPVLLGLGVLALPVIGVTVIVSEWRFGSAAERLARRMEAEGWSPEEDPDLADLPRRPSGRVEREAADAAFEEVRRAAEAAPGDWRSWFRVAVAYDVAGDRPRGRRAMRRAIALERSRPG